MSKAKCIMVQGTMSGAGKSLLCAALCRIFAQDGYRVAPFKSQNMALNSFVTRNGAEMGRAQVVQAQAAGVEPDVRMNPILLKPSSDVGSQVIVNGKARGQMPAAAYFKMKRSLIPDILEAYNSLGNMIVDIGGGTTEIAVISLGGIVSNNSIKMAGDDFTSDIQEYMSRQHNVRVSERMAERIKINVGAALTDLPNPPKDYLIHGPNRITTMPMEVPVCYQEIAHCLETSIAKIEQAVVNALANTPPELYADIVKNGIYLTGGGALLRGLDKRLSDKINIPFHVAEDPLLCVAKGTGIALKNVENFTFLMR